LPTFDDPKVLLILLSMFAAFLFLALPDLAFAQVPESLTIEVTKDGQATVTEHFAASTTISRITVEAKTDVVTNILHVDESNVVLSFSNDGS
jgi:hypothetical protein